MQVSLHSTCILRIREQIELVTAHNSQVATTNLVTIILQFDIIMRMMQYRGIILCH